MINNEYLLDLFFTQSLDGVFFMIIDEPIEWNDTVDKDKILDYVFENQRITKINDAMLDQYRAKKEDFIGLTPNDLLAHDIQGGKKIWKEFFDKGRLHIDTNEKKFDGTDMTIMGDYICIYDKQGRIVGHFGVQREVTEERNAKQKIKESEERFKIIAENTSDSILVIDKHFNIEFSSENYFSKNHLPETKNLKSVLTNKDIQNLNYIEKLVDLIQRGIDAAIKSNFFILDLIDDKNNIIWLEHKVKFIYTSTGFLENIYIISNEITDKLRRNNQIEQLNQEAIRATKYYKNLLNNQSFYIIKTDIQGNYTYHNAYFVNKLLGGGSALGTNSMDSIFEEDHPKCFVVVKKCLESPNIPYNVELRKIAPNGKMIKNFWEFRAMTNERNEIEEILCIGFDISEKDELQVELDLTLSELKSKNEKLQNFAYIVAHNLKTHSLNISNLISLLNQELPNLSQNEYYSYLEKASENLAETIKVLSEVAEIHLKIGSEYKYYNISNIINDSITNIIGLANKEKVNIINESQEYYVLGEKTYLESIVLNFLTNAIKYKSNNENSFVRIKTYRDKDYIIISFEDNGIGIDLERHSDKMFRIFKTFHDHPDAKGIGLFMTKHQIDAMGGKVEVESEVGVGTTFKIFLKGKTENEL